MTAANPTSPTVRQPVIFLPHGGGPCFFMDWTWGPPDTWHATERFLAKLASTLPAPPKALLVISGHWEEPVFTARADADPELYYDYYGFPEHTYRLTWPAPGEPSLAVKTVQLLREAGLEARPVQGRGYDHGVFIPLKVAFPEAEIPTVQLSLVHGLDPEQHLAAGRALAPLRDEGVLILASGMSFHNQNAYYRPGTQEKSRAFDQWLTESIEADPAERQRRLAHWEQGPEALYAHPREEHLLPLMVAAGAAGDSPGRRIFNDEPMQAALSAYRFD